MSWVSGSELSSAKRNVRSKTCFHINSKSLKAKSRVTDSKVIIRNLRASLKEQRILTSEDIMLSIAVSTNNTELVQTLLEKGAGPNIVDSQERTPLHLAVSKGYTEVVNLLLAHGANRNMQDVVGNTPLHLAACTSNLKMITILINAGADVTVFDLHGRTPLELAQSKLQILKRNWNCGTIEMIHFRKQLEQITDVMIAIRKRNIDIFASESHPTLDLELMKLSIKDGTKEDVDGQISRLEEELNNFSLK